MESGQWTVGRDGVEGTIDTFRDADRGAWRDYWISPDWSFCLVNLWTDVFVWILLIISL